MASACRWSKDHCGPSGAANGGQLAVDFRAGPSSVGGPSAISRERHLPAPTEGILVTQFITVRSVARSRAFYSEVLGGQVVLEENPCIVKLANSWLLMNPGGPPTPDKPDISVVDYKPGNTVSSFMNLRVADIQACYEQWSAKGAEFLTPPIDRGAEIRCYIETPTAT